MTDTVVMDSVDNVTEAAEIQVAAYAGYQIELVPAPFTAKDNVIYLNNVPVVTHIKGLSIVNSNARKTFNVEQVDAFDDIMLELMTSGRTIKRLTDTKDFYDGEKQFNIFANAKEADLHAVFKSNEDVGLNLTYGDLSVISAFNALQERFKVHYESIKPVALYERAKQAGESQLYISGNVGRRTLSNYNYSMGEKTGKRLWDVAFARWSDPSKTSNSATSLSSVRASGYDRTARVYDNRIELGCQSFTRWQIEDLAERMGWAFA